MWRDSESGLEEGTFSWQIKRAFELAPASKMYPQCTFDSSNQRECSPNVLNFDDQSSSHDALRMNFSLCTSLQV